MARTKASLLLMATTFLTAAVLFCLPVTPRPVVTTVLVEEGELVQSVLLSGTVRYTQETACFSPLDGRVEKVYAVPGQTVRKGDLLFKLDTSVQEKALSACMQASHESESLPAALLLSDRMELWQMEETLRAEIAASQIRAQADGIVEAVYVQEGGYVQMGGVLGWTRGWSKCVQASATAAQAAQIPSGAAAVFSQGGTGWLDAKGAPGTDGMMLLMTFLPADSAALQTRAVGETVAVEVLTASQNQAALAPLAAVSAHHEVWIVEDGTARPVPVQIRGQNATHAAIDASLAGSRVILLPDEYALVPGCAVKEAGR